MGSGTRLEVPVVSEFVLVWINWSLLLGGGFVGSWALKSIVFIVVGCTISRCGSR